MILYRNKHIEQSNAGPDQIVIETEMNLVDGDGVRVSDTPDGLGLHSVVTYVDKTATAAEINAAIVDTAIALADTSFALAVARADVYYQPFERGS